MSKIALAGAVSGTATFTIESPATSTNRTLTLPDNTGTIITQNSTPAFASTIGVGGATAAASGAGITFPATQSASSDANTLDDYEEGTWTPTVAGGTTAGTTTYTTQRGFYTKIGRAVTVACKVSYSAATGTGAIQVGSLPFASGGGTGAEYYGSIMTSNLNWPSAGVITPYVNGGSNQNYIEIYVSTDDGALASLSISNESADIWIQITYFV
jgi:hypothetical protein